MRLDRVLGVGLILLPLAAAGIEPGEGTIEVSGTSALSMGSTRTESTYTSPGMPASSGESSGTSLSLSGGVLYYFSPAVGVGLDLAWSSDETSSGSYQRTIRSTAVSPKIGGETPITEDVSLFADVRLGYQLSSTETRGSSTTPDGTVTFHGVRFGVRGGVKWFPAENVSLNAGAEYVAVRQAADQPGGATQENRTSTLRAIAGVSIYFGR